MTRATIVFFILYSETDSTEDKAKQLKDKVAFDKTFFRVKQIFCEKEHLFCCPWMQFKHL